MTIVHHPSTDRETNAIEHLDFVPPCGYSSHQGPESAVWAVIFRQPLTCGCPGPDCLYFCGKCWAFRNSWGVTRCRHCNQWAPAMADVLRVERI